MSDTNIDMSGTGIDMSDTEYARSVLIKVCLVHTVMYNYICKEYLCLVQIV